MSNSLEMLPLCCQLRQAAISTGHSLRIKGMPLALDYTVLSELFLGFVAVLLPFEQAT